MLDYKDILTRRYVLRLSLREIAEKTGAGKSGVHDFLKAFEKHIRKACFPFLNV